MVDGAEIADRGMTAARVIPGGAGLDHVHPGRILWSHTRRVTTDQHPAYRRAIRWILGRKVLHRTTRYLNNYTEQSHRAVKQRYYPMLGFGSFESAARFCSAFDELREYFRVRRRGEGHVSLAEQR